MGHGRWDNSSRTSYRAFADTASSTMDYREVFRSRSIHKDLDPKNVVIRESCDSETNPNSNAIIVALDVTGSMGMIAHEMAKKGLGQLIEGILDRKPVEDPHVMFMAIGDVRSDEAPLQASQFEPDIRIAQQLKDIYVEGRGGGNNSESYDFPWYFAGTRTKLDCFDKRGKKGYLFTIGDEMTPHGLTRDHINTALGKSEERDYSASESLKLAEEKYHVFHVIVEQGHYASRMPDRVRDDWRQLLGPRAILLSDYNHLSQVILSAMEVSEGREAEDVVASWEDPDVRKTVQHALFD